jgi:hypothetical protein
MTLLQHKYDIENNIEIGGVCTAKMFIDIVSHAITAGKDDNSFNKFSKVLVGKTTVFFAN